MNKKIISLISIFVAALLLCGCDPLEALTNFLDDVKPDNPALTSEVAEHRKTLTGYGYEALKTEAERDAYATVDYLAQRGSSTSVMTRRITVFTSAMEKGFITRAVKLKCSTPFSA